MEAFVLHGVLGDRAGHLSFSKQLPHAVSEVAVGVAFVNGGDFGLFCIEADDVRQGANPPPVASSRSKHRHEFLILGLRHLTGLDRLQDLGAQSLAKILQQAVKGCA